MGVSGCGCIARITTATAPRWDRRWPLLGSSVTAVRQAALLPFATAGGIALAPRALVAGEVRAGRSADSEQRHH